MPPRHWKLRLADILSAITAIEGYVRGMDLASFVADRRTVDAVVRNMIVIGEAAANVPDEIADSYPEVPWHVMSAFRNVVVHVYFGVDEEVLWDTLQNDLPPLVPLLRRILEADE